MWLQKWVLLPALPFHLHAWHYLKQIVSNVGTPLELDMATKNRNRPSMAKIRVKIDLLKPQPDQVWFGIEKENSHLKGFYQKLEYEGIPKYCRHCRKLGHMMVDCRVLEKKKAAEAKKIENDNATIQIQESNPEENRNKIDVPEKVENKNGNKKNDKATTNATQNRRDGTDKVAKNNYQVGKGEDNAKSSKKANNKKMPNKKPSMLLNIIQSTKRKKQRKKEKKAKESSNSTEERMTNMNNNVSSQPSAPNIGIELPDTQQVDEGLSLNAQYQQLEKIAQSSPDKVDQLANNNDNIIFHNNNQQNMQPHLYNLDKETLSILLEIRALPGIKLTVDLNTGPDNLYDEETNQEQKENGEAKKQQHSEDKENNNVHQQIEVSSPNRITVMIPKDQLQTETVETNNNDGFSPARNTKNKIKKNNKKDKDNTYSRNKRRNKN
ncbi:uncharacterized protein LOC132606002 [Lycium barbarum]|uniref:uncharacterized protein LOC132606002 n=1 Tax=Lycium barbarum TaxID=112863 RepID=UPI00293E08D2|nr:uncharacterized protein LOC132606002 [Lycium barbarum]